MPTAADDIAERLEAEIVEGRLGPGARLEEPALAARFGVSRTPVREALQRLSAAGLIELKPRATRVIRPSLVDVIERFEVMAEMEAACARLAARRVTATAQAALAAALAECEAAAGPGTDPSVYYLANLGFHRALYAASGNAFLAAQCEALHLRLTPFRRQQLRLPRRVPQSQVEHRAIADAIAAGDAAAAANTARRHITIQGEGFGALIAQLRHDGPGQGAGAAGSGADAGARADTSRRAASA